MKLGKRLTPDQQAELDHIRARQAYGIHRNSDYNREHELTTTPLTKIGEALLIGAAFVLGFGWIILPFVFG